MNQAVPRRLLQKRGHIVTTVDNGHEALAALEKGTFDLILMDVPMPEMAGLEATAAIRSRDRPGMRAAVAPAHFTCNTNDSVTVRPSASSAVNV